MAKALQATQESATATDNAYDLASKSVSLVEGILGKDDPLVTVLRGRRPTLHNDPSPTPTP